MLPDSRQIHVEMGQPKRFPRPFQYPVDDDGKTEELKVTTVMSMNYSLRALTNNSLASVSSSTKAYVNYGIVRGIPRAKVVIQRITARQAVRRGKSRYDG